MEEHFVFRMLKRDIFVLILLVLMVTFSYIMPMSPVVMGSYIWDLELGNEERAFGVSVFMSETDLLPGSNFSESCK